MSDYISRADAIGAMGEEPPIVFDLETEWEVHDVWVRNVRALSALPSADAVSREEYEETDGVIAIEKQSAKDVGEIKHIVIHSPNYTRYFYNESMPTSAEAEPKVLTEDDYWKALSADAEQVTSKLKNPCDSLLTGDSDGSKEHGCKLESADVAPKIDHDRDWIIGCLQHDGFIHTHRFDKANQIILDALSSEQGWIPFTRRPMTEEEQKDYPNCTFMFDCVLPDDGDEILVSNKRFVWMDVFCNDVDGCYLDGGDDIDEDMAWMPLPKPYKGGDAE